MRDEIQAWINEGCNLEKGIALYLCFGSNESFKIALKNDPIKVQKRLKLLLCSMSGSSISSGAPEVKKNEEDRFRTMYPFLNKRNLPGEIKILATDKMSTYWDLVKLHDQLFLCHSNADCLNTAKKIVETFREDQMIKAELDHFRDYGKLLGKHRIFNETQRLDALRQMNIRELFRKEKQIRDNIWRIKSEMTRGDKPHLDGERKMRLEERERELSIVLNMIG